MTKSEIEAMDFEARIELAISLGESISQSILNDSTIAEEHKSILEKRVREFIAAPQAGSSMEEIQQRLKHRLKHA